MRRLPLTVLSFTEGKMLNKIRSVVGGHEWKWLVPAPIRRTIRAVVPGVQPDELQEVGSRIFKITDGRILNGPFQGMHYIQQATGSAYCPKLLGTYEMEIAQIITLALDDSYDVLIDAGAAEGYYAIGAACRCPNIKVVAFEQSENGRSLLQSLGERNAVLNRVAIRGSCDHASLRESLSIANRSLLICDIDGGEIELLDPVIVPELRNADILVELHDCFRKGISPEILRRFEPSHEIQIIWSKPRRAGDCPLKAQLGRKRASLAVQEHRPAKQSWFWMRARAPEIQK